MIVEHAQFTISAGREAEFEAAFASAIAIIAASTGYLGHELRRCIESPQRYLLLVRWRSLEDHTAGFRGSPAFAEWRAQIGGFFASPPFVEHFRSVHAAGAI